MEGQKIGQSRLKRDTQRRSAGTDHQEVEWQFDADDLGRVGCWLEEGSGSSGVFVKSGEEKELDDTYYDTRDWRLYRAGYALRIRKLDHRRSEATMKSLASAAGSGNARRRREISEPLRGNGPDAVLSKKSLGPVGKCLEALAGARELHPLFEVHTRRRTFDLFEVQTDSPEGSVESRNDDGASWIVQDASGNVRRAGIGSRVGEAALDESEVPLGDEPVLLRRVEVEAETSEADTSSDLLENFAGMLEKELELRSATASKYELGLLAKELDPEGDLDLGPVAVKKNLSLGEVAFRVLRQQFAAMRAHEGGTRLGEDLEELHDMRVATRRMRSALKFFEDALPEEAQRIRGELKFFAGVLGEVRDLDVQIEQLETWISEADEEDRELLSKAVGALEKRRVPARETLLDALDSKRYDRFESSFATFLQQGPAADGHADEPILAVAPDLLSRPHRKWRKAAGRVDGMSRPEEYHDLRKKGKRLRYALEFLSGVYGKKVIGKIVEPLKTLQDDLGEHQDLIVSADLLKQLAIKGSKLPPETAFAMGALAERNFQKAAGLRTSLPDSKAYRKLIKGKAWKDLEKFAKERRSEAKAKVKRTKRK